MLKSNDIDAEQELIDEIRKYVSDSEANTNIRAKINKFECYLYKDFDTILRRIYKLGFIDGYNFKKEIKSLLEENNNNK